MHSDERIETPLPGIEADITQTSLPPSRYDLWHDRAVFHFLTDAKDRRSYIRTVGESLKPGGYLIVATFAPEGPQKCSGLNIVRYSPDELRNEFGDDYLLLESVGKEHSHSFRHRATVHLLSVPGA